MRVYGYTRVSTVSQAEEGESIDTQKYKIEEYCKKNDYDLLKIFCDAGISGAISPRQRPELNKILLNIEAGNGEGLVVCKIDRLSRSIKDFINLIDEFNKKKYSIFIINPDINSDSTTGKFTLHLLSAIAELEKNMIQQRTRETLQNMKRKGMRTGSIPFGKQILNNELIMSDHDEEQKTILIAKELRQQKILYKGKEKSRTYQYICNELMNQGRKNKDGESVFYPSQARRMVMLGSF